MSVRHGEFAPRAIALWPGGTRMTSRRETPHNRPHAPPSATVTAPNSGQSTANSTATCLAGKGHAERVTSGPACRAESRPDLSRANRNDSAGCSVAAGQTSAASMCSESSLTADLGAFGGERPGRTAQRPRSNQIQTAHRLDADPLPAQRLQRHLARVKMTSPKRRMETDLHKLCVRSASPCCPARLS